MPQWHGQIWYGEPATPPMSPACPEDLEGGGAGGGRATTTSNQHFQQPTTTNCIRVNDTNCTNEALATRPG